MFHPGRGYLGIRREPHGHPGTRYLRPATAGLRNASLASAPRAPIIGGSTTLLVPGGSVTRGSRVWSYRPSSRGGAARAGLR